jgi:protease II
VAIFGGSYGGYAALAGATFTPDLYRCAVDLVGPSSLFTLLASFPPYWAPIISLFKTRMGDPDKPGDREMLRSASPLFAADRIRIPLLIAQGANDPRVTQIESEQIVAAIEKNGALSNTCSIRTRATASSVPPTTWISWRERKNSSPSTWADATSQWKARASPVPPRSLR